MALGEEVLVTRPFDVAQNQPLRVLLIDSDPVHLDRWSALLSYAGYEASCARTCLDAAQQLARGVHCIVLDYRLPDMNGVDFIRYFSTAAGLSLILFTRETSPVVHLRALEAGAAATLEKPSSVHDVLSAIEQACWKVPHASARYGPNEMVA
jgi:DNA-binding response OmpR family regulator